MKAQVEQLIRALKTLIVPGHIYMGTAVVELDSRESREPSCCSEAREVLSGHGVTSIVHPTQWFIAKLYVP